MILEILYSWFLLLLCISDQYQIYRLMPLSLQQFFASGHASWWKMFARCGEFWDWPWASPPPGVL